MAQAEYWKEHTNTLDGATVNAMMLDSQVRTSLLPYSLDFGIDRNM